MITRVGSITLEVPKLAESVAFFEQKIGLSVTEQVGSTCFLTSTDRHHEMVLVQSATGQTALRHLNLEVAEGQLGTSVSLALAAGARDCGAIEHAGIAEGRVIEIPGGLGVKLYTGMQTVAAPSDLALPRPTNFSHINIGVPDVARIVEFMMTGLGLRPSDWIRSKENPFLAFLHCPVEDAAHHGIAILESEQVKLHHIAFDYQAVNDVAARVDNYVDQSHYLVWGMGRHGTGGSIFAYIEDISGMLVELGSGMIHVDHDPRWRGPRVWSLDDPRAVDEWGSSVPERWLGKRVDVLSPDGKSAPP